MKNSHSWRRTVVQGDLPAQERTFWKSRSIRIRRSTRRVSVRYRCFPHKSSTNKSRLARFDRRWELYIPRQMGRSLVIPFDSKMGQDFQQRSCVASQVSAKGRIVNLRYIEWSYGHSRCLGIPKMGYFWSLWSDILRSVLSVEERNFHNC